MEYKGTLIRKSDAVRVSEKFVKREFVVSDNAPSYPQTLLFELTQDRCKEIDDINAGDEINIHYQLKGREWKNPEGVLKVFNTLNAFKVSVVKKGTASAPQSSAPQQENAPVQEPTLEPVPDDDLPF